MIELLKRFNNWINNCYNDKAWGMLTINLVIVTIGYSLLSWSPELYSWLTGKKISVFITPQRHHWHMMIANGMVAVGIFVAAVRVIQLIKHQDWFTQRHQNKKLADERLDAEISERKAEKSINKRKLKQ